MIDWVVSKAVELLEFVACKLVLVESEGDKIDIHKYWRV
jgi:hypothetical protein